MEKPKKAPTAKKPKSNMIFAIYNRITGEYKIGNKVVDSHTWWVHVKHVIINVPGSLAQDDKFILMYTHTPTLK